MPGDRAPNGEGLLLLATFVAIQLSAGKKAEEISTTAAFFTVLGDSMALIAARRSAEESTRGQQAN